MSKSKNSLNNAEHNKLESNSHHYIHSYEKKKESKKKMSVRDIASIFEQKAKQNPPLQSCVRKKSMDNFSSTSSHKFTQNPKNTKEIINPKENEKLTEDKLMYVSDYSKSINKEIDTKMAHTIHNKKRSHSLKPQIRENIFKQENNTKVNSTHEISVNINTDPFPIIEINENNKKGKNCDQQNFGKKIVEQKFNECLTKKELNRIDLSIISEKDDQNTSISFMEHNKETKMKNFILNAINELKSISKEETIKNSTTHKTMNKNDAIKSTFIKNKKDPKNERKLFNNLTNTSTYDNILELEESSHDILEEIQSETILIEENQKVTENIDVKEKSKFSGNVIQLQNDMKINETDIKYNQLYNEDRLNIVCIENSDQTIHILREEHCNLQQIKNDNESHCKIKPESVSKNYKMLKIEKNYNNDEIDELVQTQIIPSISENFPRELNEVHNIDITEHSITDNRKHKRYKSQEHKYSYSYFFNNDDTLVKPNLGRIFNRFLFITFFTMYEIPIFYYFIKQYKIKLEFS